MEDRDYLGGGGESGTDDYRDELLHSLLAYTFEVLSLRSHEIDIIEDLGFQLQGKKFKVWCLWFLIRSLCQV